MPGDPSFAVLLAMPLPPVQETRPAAGSTTRPAPHALIRSHFGRQTLIGCHDAEAGEPGFGRRRAGGGSLLAARPAPMNCPYRCAADRLYRQLAPPAHCAAPAAIAPTPPDHR